MVPLNRGQNDRQQLMRRLDVRIAKVFKGRNGAETEIAWVVQGLFAKGHLDYMDSNVYQPRTYLSAALSF